MELYYCWSETVAKGGRASPYCYVFEHNNIKYVINQFLCPEQFIVKKQEYPDLVCHFITDDDDIDSVARIQNVFHRNYSALDKNDFIKYY